MHEMLDFIQTKTVVGDRMKQPESLIRDAIVDYLYTRKRIFFDVIRNSAPWTGKAFGRLPKGCKKGTPDIIVFHWGGAILIECKSKTGKIRPDQIMYRDEANKIKGVEYIIARSVEDVQKVI